MLTVMLTVTVMLVPLGSYFQRYDSEISLHMVALMLCATYSSTAPVIE